MHHPCAFTSSPSSRSEDLIISVAQMQEQDRCEAREEAQRASELAAYLRKPPDIKMLAARMPNFFLMDIHFAVNLEEAKEDSLLLDIAENMSKARAEAINVLKMHDQEIEEMKRERHHQVADLEKKMLAIQLEQGAVGVVPSGVPSPE